MPNLTVSDNPQTLSNAITSLLVENSEDDSIDDLWAELPLDSWEKQR